MKRQVGQRLALLRERKGLTQTQLAERLGWFPYRVSRYECGTHMPPVEALLALSGALDVSVDLMLTGRQRGVQSAAVLQRVLALERLPQDELARALKVIDGYLAGSTGLKSPR